MPPPNPLLVAADIFDPPTTGGDLAECRADVATFIERHCTIEEPDGTVLPFELWDFQRDTLADLQAGESVVVLKARRLGLSWVVLAYALWLAIFHQGIRILVLCKTGDDAAELLDRIRRMRDRIAENPGSAHILSGLQQGAKNRDAVTTLDIGSSTIRALMGTPAAARSETAGFVVLDEFAFQRGADEIWRAIYPTIEGGGQIAAVSTGNGSEHSKGMGAEFAKLWRRSKLGLSGIRPLFFSWRRRPDRDEDWRKAALAALGDEMRFRIEYPEVEDDAFLVADADLIYPGAHIDAAEKAGGEYDAMPPGQRPWGLLYLGVDFGVNTHMVLARLMPSGGLYAVAEVFSTNADLDADVEKLCRVLDDLGDEPRFLRYDPGGPGAKVIGTFVRLIQAKRPAFAPKVMKIPFSKYKVVAIRYLKLLLRRAHDQEPLRVIAISPAGCPELLRQLRGAEWKDPDVGKTEKGDDHGSDALLTVVAEFGFAMYRNDPEG